MPTQLLAVLILNGEAKDLSGRAASPQEEETSLTLNIERLIIRLPQVWGREALMSSLASAIGRGCNRKLTNSVAAKQKENKGETSSAQSRFRSSSEQLHYWRQAAANSTRSWGRE